MVGQFQDTNKIESSEHMPQNSLRVIDNNNKVLERVKQAHVTCVSTQKVNSKLLKFYHNWKDIPRY
jgi:hypothetical protein